MQLVSGEDFADELHFRTEVGDILSKYPAPMKIITFIGDLRTGKSTTANMLLKSSTKFAVGHSMDVVTHGLWMSPPLPLPRANTGTSTTTAPRVVVCDTEGRGIGSAKFIQRLTSFSALMSSGLVLLLRGPPSHHQFYQPLSELAVVAQMAQGQITSDVMPHLFVLFSTDLQLSSNAHTADTLLSKALYPREHDDGFNSVREQINQLFPSNKRVAYYVGTPDKQDINGTTGEVDMESRYGRTLQAALLDIVERTPVKMVNRAEGDGQTLRRFAEQTCRALNKIDLPHFDPLAVLFTSLLTTRVEELTAQYKNHVSSLVAGFKDVVEFDKVHAKVKTDMINLLKETLEQNRLDQLEAMVTTFTENLDLRIEYTANVFRTSIIDKQLAAEAEKTKALEAESAEQQRHKEDMQQLRQQREKVEKEHAKVEAKLKEEPDIFTLIAVHIVLDLLYRTGSALGLL